MRVIQLLKMQTCNVFSSSFLHSQKLRETPAISTNDVSGSSMFTNAYLMFHVAIRFDFFTVLPQSLEYYSLAFLWHSIHYDSSYSEQFSVTFDTPFVFLSHKHMLAAITDRSWWYSKCRMTFLLHFVLILIRSEQVIFFLNFPIFFDLPKLDMKPWKFGRRLLLLLRIQQPSTDYNYILSYRVTKKCFRQKFLKFY